MIKRTREKITVSKIVLNLVAWCVSLTMLFPLIWLAYSSVKSNGEFMMDTLALPNEIVLSNYPKAFEIGQLWTAIGNSALYSAVNIVVIVFFAITTAYFMARYDFKGKKIIRLTYIMGMLIPLYALLVPVFVQYRLLDMINDRSALMITNYGMCISLAIFLAESFIRDIPVEIDEAAIIDGCTVFQRLFSTIFPLCKPIIATICILTLLATWNEFAFAVILTPDIDLRTVSIALRYFTTGNNLDYTFLMAALLATSLPIIVTYLIFSKNVIKGMTSGAVKG